ncbi:uncharacterized protein A1O9_06732 [Exophiala aquamarina CBS 119918]|uniref:Uncharacterized protein n=1 Tax=Exophiala aquamarina CBS 119918 TaxID=1182545 RepID=A0A072P8U6_9EURO|nr:uncharacterized protein A1O9_06732 [Exophiala aquamarina CBS 119918]KEF56544.1 hypothetical protein A1O9_06732 [Exophiala aquamarina CBS 119918]
MAPTTLNTFLVRTPPSTRSVALYGSWDNFSTPYPMQRDSRTGQEHWSGCHSFSNIICDGDPQPAGVPRDGGLKMGGTYWYYYKLDDDIEFHNSAEPSTASCPMLPGQLVNVLNVPFALSSSRSRNDSVSSTGSEYRTMNPTDKFMNPRPVPAKPSLPRLKTSPTLSQQTWSTGSSPTSAGSRRGRSASSRGPSQPGSANTLRIIRLARKPSMDVPSRSNSRGSNRSVGIIGAFKALASPRSTSPETSIERGRSKSSNQDVPVTHARGSSGHSGLSKKTVLSRTPPIPEVTELSPTGPARELVLRREFDETIDGNLGLAITSFQQHRRQRSLSREPSSLRNSLLLDEVSGQKSSEIPSTAYKPMETLKEIASTANTPLWPLTAIKIEGENLVDDGKNGLDLEKRLPTLPNSPSSAYPPSSIAGDSPRQRFEEELANIQSHFSATTIDTESYTNSYINNNQSRFSDWTSSTTRFSPTSDYAASVTDLEPMSPSVELDHTMKEVNPVFVAGKNEQKIDSEARGYTAPTADALSSAFSFSTISSIASSAGPSSHTDLDSAKDADFSWSKFQHYSLPTDESESNATFKQAASPKNVSPLVLEAADRDQGFQPPLASFNGSTMPHSTSMQQLLDELSYLGDMIQHT